MALNSSRPRKWWSSLHFLIRFAALTGLACAGVGTALAFLHDVLERVFSPDLPAAWAFVRSVLSGQAGDLSTRVAVGFLVGGAVLALLGLVVELLVILTTVAGRRSAFGLNATAQVALASALLLGVNLYSYRHYLRLDWTREQQFTLPSDIQAQLRSLDGKTTIIVYQRHKTFGQLNDKPDATDYAAERKAVEKVKDLVEQFREFGPQFDVHVLDVEEEGFNKKLEALTERNKVLRDAIDAAPDNSIFFAAGDNVQRLSFDEFYHLDKTASQKADEGRGNLVLLPQGVDSFARKVLKNDEKRPTIGILVIHEWLTTQGPEDFGLAGFKKSLTARGFQVRDVILKKWSELGPPEPGVYTYDESRFDALEEELASMDADMRNLQEEQDGLQKVQQFWKTATLEELTKKYADQLRGRKVDEPLRSRQLAFIGQNIAVLQAVLRQFREERAETAREKAALNVDTAAEQRRMTDLGAKLNRVLSACDLLFVPRMTIRNLAIGDRIPERLHHLDDAQVSAIQEFLRAGKPILACFGPANENPSDAMRMAQLGSGGPDGLERLLNRLGIEFGKQTVLYNVETKSFAERRTGLLSAGVNVEVPPAEFAEPAHRNQLAAADSLPRGKPNPIRASMLIETSSRGDKPLDLRIRYPRPVYLAADKVVKLAFEPEFMLTSAASWNEDQPFPTRERTPRFEPPKADDPSRGTHDEKRRGPFPIGVAAEVPIPVDWYIQKPSQPGVVRVAAIGSGSVFSGPELSPAREELLLDTCNWLLGRDELLPRKDRIWSYPRVDLDAKTQSVWHWGTWVGLPALFAYFGLIVLMIRRLR
jgi:hypothetical protein